MRTVSIAAWLLLTSVGMASAADFTSITVERTVERPADAVWAKVGPFCAIGDWYKVTCEYISGAGDLGTVRLAGGIREVLVAKAAHSYTYTLAQPDPIMYFGTLSVVPLGPSKSKVIYAVLWNQERLPTAEAKAEEKAQKTESFSHALDDIKKFAEGK